jgi:hypothetical protein
MKCTKVPDDDFNSPRALALSELLLERGQTLANSLPYSRLSEGAIANAAGISTGDFRCVFLDLNEYLQVLQLHLDRNLTAALTVHLNSPAPIREKWELAADAYLNSSLQSAGARQWLSECSKRSLPLAAVCRRNVLRHANLFAASIEVGPKIAAAISRMLVAGLLEAAQAEACSRSHLVRMRDAIRAFIASSTNPIAFQSSLFQASR